MVWHVVMHDMYKYCDADALEDVWHAVVATYFHPWAVVLDTSGSTFEKRSGSPGTLRCCPAFRPKPVQIDENCKKKNWNPQWSSGPGLFQLLSWCLGFSNPKTHWLQKTMTWSCSLFLSGCPHLLWPCERTIVRAPAPSRSVLKGCRSAVPQWHGF